MTLLLIGIAIFSFIALCSYLYCWHDIQNGRPHILSLRQVTLIMDRNRLDNLFGKHDERYRYVLPQEMMQGLLNARRFYLYSQIAAELCCFFGAYRYLTGAGSPGTLPVFILAALICEGIDTWFSLHLARKWWHQIEEEIDGMR